MKKHTYIIVLIMALTSCSHISWTESENCPQIFPDYVGVTVPKDMAPLNFRMADGTRFTRKSELRGDTLFISVSSYDRKAGTGTHYKEFPIYLSDDAIDPYIAYRLIEPGYESWNNMGIYQRELSSFRETAIVTNEANGHGCVNCHSFNSGDPDKFIFHARGAGGGTVFVDGDSIRLQNLAATGPKKQGVYPSWHPGGRWIAFSSNSTQQSFTLNSTQPVEVYDHSSDIILVDSESGEVRTPSQLSGTPQMETFPSWSPDGRTLYYCCADSTADVALNRGAIHYALMAIDFNDGEFTGEPRTIWQSDSLSASFPRVNGDKLLFTVSAFATFPIWHKEADLWMLDLTTGEAGIAGNINSDDTESYHSWSSNGRWLLFSSRRLDGRYTRLYIAHYDGEGHFDKPFLLPQKNPDFNTLRLKSYNVPEFVSGKVGDRTKQIGRLFQ